MLTNRVALSIRKKLTEAFRPTLLEVINESHKHNVPKDSETHFKVVIVSDFFTGRKLIESHRLVNTILKEELKNGVHALSITTKSPEQHEENPTIANTPPCLGGEKKRDV